MNTWQSLAIPWQYSAILVAAGWILPAIVLYRAIKFDLHGHSARYRLTVARVCFVLVISMFLGVFVAVSRTPRRLHAPDYAALVLWLVQCVIWGYLWRMAGQRLKLELSATLPPKGQKGFFWQGSLILLPVAIMTVIGLLSLRQDKLLAEQDARESGSSLARILMKAAGDEAKNQLQEYRNAIFEAQFERTGVLSLTQWRSGTDLAEVRKRIEDWQRAHPDLDLSTMPVPDAVARLDGEIIAPREYPFSPGPPAWLTELTPEQLLLWRQAERAEFVSGDLAAAESAIERFLAANPPKGAQHYAEFLSLKLKSAQLAPDKAAGLFAASIWAKSDELTDAGLPVGQLICYQALRLTPDHAGLSTKFLKTIAWAINYRPSIMSPRLIAEVERVVGLAGSESEQGAMAMKGWWEVEERARQVLEDFRDQRPASSWTNGAYWATSGGNGFLIDLAREDGPFTTPTPEGDVVVSNQPPVWEIHLYTQKVVEMALRQGIAKADTSIPRYARVMLEIGGAEFDLDDGARIQKTVAADSPVLGEAAGHMQLLPKPIGAEGFPFHVGVYLAHPDILYSRQRQRTWLFGGLILFSAIAAGIGYLAARRAFYRQLRLNEMKSDFVSSVSHELRAPIASVRLMAEGLERGRISEPGKQHEYFKFIVQECRRLSSLIENVLDFSRIEQGRKQYEMESTDLVALTEKTVALMETYAAERQIRLVLKKTGEPAPVEMDGKAMQQALVNLIDNAIKHSPKGAEITVGLEFLKCGVRSAECGMKGDEGSEPSVKLWVEDRGEGIPAVEHEKIFERFYRVGSELRRETQGVGIGLSIVKHIVEAHGGRVTVRSAPGEGSRFAILLPATNHEEDQMKPRS